MDDALPISSIAVTYSWEIISFWHVKEEKNKHKYVNRVIDSLSRWNPNAAYMKKLIYKFYGVDNEASII